MKAGIINVTGYAGVELARILARHPSVKLTSVTGRGEAGKNLAQVFPHLDDIDMPITEELGDVDVAFSALPQVASAPAVVSCLKRGIKAVDISADFRLRNPKVYKEWYGSDHPAPELLDEAVYGLVELDRDRISKARLIANPGCYPTGAVLALAPALKDGIIGPDIIIDSKSGTSGAGRSLALNVHHSEANENFSAYGLSGHRHWPEISQELQRYSRAPVRVTFVPHLAPMTRGILSTCYAPLTGELTQAQVTELYRSFYKGETFVRVTAAPPQTKHTWGNNRCLVYPVVDKRAGRLIVISCIDNLVKGAAGQAVQCMNLILGLPETAGLDALAVYP